MEDTSYPNMAVTLTREEWRDLEPYLKQIQEEAGKKWTDISLSNNVKKAYYDDWTIVTKLLNKINQQLKGE